MMGPCSSHSWWWRGSCTSMFLCESAGLHTTAATTTPFWIRRLMRRITYRNVCTLSLMCWLVWFSSYSPTSLTRRQVHTDSALISHMVSIGLPTPWKINKGPPRRLGNFFLCLFCVWNDFQIISLECEFSSMHVFEWYKYIEKKYYSTIYFLCKIRYF